MKNDERQSVAMCEEAENGEVVLWLGKDSKNWAEPHPAYEGQPHDLPEFLAHVGDGL